MHEGNLESWDSSVYRWVDLGVVDGRSLSGSVRIFLGGGVSGAKMKWLGPLRPEATVASGKELVRQGLRS
jgi:hypothetical protein